MASYALHWTLAIVIVVLVWANNNAELAGTCIAGKAAAVQPSNIGAMKQGSQPLLRAGAGSAVGGSQGTSHQRVRWGLLKLLGVYFSLQRFALACVYLLSGSTLAGLHMSCLGVLCAGLYMSV